MHISLERPKLSENQADVYDFVVEYMGLVHKAPTLLEISGKTTLSVSEVRVYLLDLMRKGYLGRKWPNAKGAERNLILVDR